MSLNLDFSDILIVPKSSSIDSRSKVDLTVAYSFEQHSKESDNVDHNHLENLEKERLEQERLAKEWIEKERASMPQKLQKKMNVSLKVDKETKMGIVSDVKQELRKANALKINYNAITGEL